MINTSWKTTVCAVASGLLLAIGACSSGQQEQEETLAISQSEEAANLGSDFEVAEASNEAIDDALAETLAAVEGTSDSTAGEDVPSVEEVLNQAEEAVNANIAEEASDATALEGGSITDQTLANSANSDDSYNSKMAEGETFTYVVRQDDWLSKITRNVYGDQSMWQQVADENGLSNPDLIMPGQKLTFRVTNEQSRNFQNSYARVNWYEGNSALRNGQNGFYDVLVVKGDSLSKIAERLLGNYNGWAKIYEANNV